MVSFVCIGRFHTYVAIDGHADAADDNISTSNPLAASEPSGGDVEDTEAGYRSVRVSVPVSLPTKTTTGKVTQGQYENVPTNPLHDEIADLTTES
jgi:hypothetical protein